MDEVMYIKKGICVPNLEFLKKQIMIEAYMTPYSVHLGASKMYKDFKENFGGKYEE